MRAQSTESTFANARPSQRGRPHTETRSQPAKECIDWQAAEWWEGCGIGWRGQRRVRANLAWHAFVATFHLGDIGVPGCVLWGF